MGLIRFLAKQKVFANMMAVFLIFTGVFTFATSPKESLPEIKLGIIIISTIYPDAAPQEVEKLVTSPVEDAVKNIKGIKQITSSSSDSVSLVVLTLEPDVKDTQNLLNNIKNSVDRITTLPENAEAPEVTELTSDEFPVITAQLSGGADYAALRQAASAFEEKLKEIRGVSSVQKAGYADRAIWVEGDVTKCSEYGLNILSVINAVRGSNIAIPAGSKKLNGSEYSIRAISDLENSEDVKNVIVRANESGRALKVRDMAKVYDGFKDLSSVIKADNEQAVILTVLKSRGRDSVKLSADIRKMAEEFKKEQPEGIKLSFSNDASSFIKDRLSVVYSNGLLGGVLVLVILVLFIRPSVALVTAFSIPVTFGASLIMLKLLGYSYDMLSLFGYVMVLGMIVDNSIVVGENVYRYMTECKCTEEAVVKGAGEVFVPAFASILTTIASFFPLILVSGILGSFLRPIPTAIIITLAVSLVLAYTILPAQLNAFLKGGDTSYTLRQESWFNAIKEKYGVLLSAAMKHRLVFVAGVAVLFVVSMWLGTLKGVEFFNSNSTEIAVNVKASPQFALEDTDKVITEMTQRIMEVQKDNIETVISYAGQQVPASGSPRLASNIGDIKVFLKLESQRPEKDQEKILASVRDAVGLPEGVEEVTAAPVRREGGGARQDILIDVTGASYAEIQKAADELIPKIAAINGVKSVSGDLEKGKKEIRLRINNERATAAGVNPAQIGAALRGVVSGSKATSIKAFGEDVDVIVKADDNMINSIGAILSCSVPNITGRSVPIRPFVTVEEGYSFTVLKHKDTKKSLSISGSIDKKISSVAKVNTEIGKIAYEITKAYPQVKFSFGGEFKEMMESFIDLGKAFLIAMVLIYIILATLFNSFTQPFVIMLAIPFGLIGVMLTLFIHAEPISFGVFMGFVALSGVVVNNSLILNDFVNRIKGKMQNAHDAIIEASKIRLRPILLTTFTTAAGLLPLAYGLFGNKDAFLQPVALVFAWGLLFSTAVTLFIIPMFLVILYGKK